MCSSMFLDLAENVGNQGKKRENWNVFVSIVTFQTEE